jgi:ABC-2 type transport system permease protein
MWMTRDFRFFAINVVSDVILSVSGLVGVFLLAESFAGIGVWSRDQMVFMLGYATLVEGILVMFCSYNVLHVSRRIGRAQLDHTLIQPQPIWMALLTKVPCLFPAAGVLSPAWGSMPGPLSNWRWPLVSTGGFATEST